MPHYKLSLFIFRRDLRLQDNTALIEALKHSEKVVPCFIFDYQQMQKNEYFSEKAFYFMLQSLQDLYEELSSQEAKLYIFKGDPANIVKQLIRTYKIDAVYVNRDYTPYSVKRDRVIQQTVENLGKEFHSLGDVLLHEPEEIYKEDGNPYTTYIPFMKKSRTLDVIKPQCNVYSNYFSAKIDLPSIFSLKGFSEKSNRSAPLLEGGRKSAEKLLQKINSSTEASHLSAHHKFGTLSIREVYHHIVREFGVDHDVINGLYRRDFFTHIAFHFPIVFGNSFHEKYRDISWSKNQRHFMLWCEGKTGVPIVDAGMRELNETGYMHHDVRMVVASFLIKDLHIDWRRGEKYFAQKLIDYDPAVNNGNWQWVASTGCDVQLQQEKFDPEAVYIKQWVPELKALTPKEIHKLEKYTLVNHKMEAERAKKM